VVFSEEFIFFVVLDNFGTRKTTFFLTFFSKFELKKSGLSSFSSCHFFDSVGGVP
jgi:hypothetical protein